jgi:Family of unknown function (DUF6194)
MDQASIIQYVTDTFSGVNVVAGDEGVAAGDTFFIYDPERNLEPKRQFPFATIVTKDYGDFDNASNLNRPGVFRLNIGVSRETFRSLVGAPPGDAERDFSVLDHVLPHPVYGAQSWLCVLNPSVETFQTVIRPLLAEAYELAVKRRTPR